MAPPKEIAKLVLILNSDGTVAVQGPLENKMACYAMLEFGRDAVKDFKPSPIIKPLVEVPK